MISNKLATGTLTPVIDRTYPPSEAPEAVTVPRADHRAQGANTMKAIVQHTYGSPDVLELREIDKPEPQRLCRVRLSCPR
jgi:NADPH:quinone reductase-like Zn-dependent oxidoreductase